MADNVQYGSMIPGGVSEITHCQGGVLCPHGSLKDLLSMPSADIGSPPAPSRPTNGRGH